MSTAMTLTGASHWTIPTGYAGAGRVLAQLGLPEREVTLIMVDGRRREADFSLQGNERLGLFPPIGGG